MKTVQKLLPPAKNEMMYPAGGNFDLLRQRPRLASPAPCNERTILMNDPRAPQRPRGLQPFPPIGWWPALAIVAAAATSYAWIRPADHDVTAQRPYSTTYHFDYTANVPGSNVVWAAAFGGTYLALAVVGLWFAAGMVEIAVAITTR